MTTILAVDQHGNKSLLPDAKIKTLLAWFRYKSAKPIFIDDKNNKPQKVGYYLSCRGEEPLWVDLYELKPVFEQNRGE